VPAGTWPVEIDPFFGCWLWQKGTNSNGYGTAWLKTGPRLAHYHVYEQEMGHRVPEGKVADHTCRRRTCVNPAHLDIITQAENNRRIAWAYRSQRLTCLKLHDLRVHGRRTPEMGMICRICSGVWTKPEEEHLE